MAEAPILTGGRHTAGRWQPVGDVAEGRMGRTSDMSRTAAVAMIYANTLRIAVPDKVVLLIALSSLTCGGLIGGYARTCLGGGFQTAAA
jgi:hypothetical protein